MARLSINELTTFRWTFEEDVQHYKEAGIDAISVWRQKLSDFGEEKGIELLLESGLRVSSLLWAGGFTGSDGRSHKESVEDAKEAIRLGGAMDADSLIVYTGPRAGHTHNHARRLVRSALEQLIPLAADVDLTLAIEPMHIGCAADWTYLTDLSETLELLQAHDSPHFKMAFDTYHLCQNGSITPLLGEIASQIAIVQLGDAKEPPQGEPNRAPLGEGELPLVEVVQSLQSAGYDGYYDVELMGEDIEQTSYQELITQSKAAFEKLIAV